MLTATFNQNKNACPSLLAFVAVCLRSSKLFNPFGDTQSNYEANERRHSLAHFFWKKENFSHKHVLRTMLAINLLRTPRWAARFFLEISTTMTWNRKQNDLKDSSSNAIVALAHGKCIWKNFGKTGQKPSTLHHFFSSSACKQQISEPILSP